MGAGRRIETDKGVIDLDGEWRWLGVYPGLSEVLAGQAGLDAALDFDGMIPLRRHTTTEEIAQLLLDQPEWLRESRKQLAEERERQQQAQRRQRHAPIQRVKFGLRTPVSSSLGVTRTSTAARLPAGKRRMEKDSERE